jgi:hypothetical protein
MIAPPVHHSRHRAQVGAHRHFGGDFFRRRADKADSEQFRKWQFVLFESRQRVHCVTFLFNFSRDARSVHQSLKHSFIARGGHIFACDLARASFSIGTHRQVDVANRIMRHRSCDRLRSRKALSDKLATACSSKNRRGRVENTIACSENHAISKKNA